MTAAVRGLPASVALSQLARLLPEPPERGMWLGWLDLWCIELLVELVETVPLNPLERHVLETLAQKPSAASGLARHLRQFAIWRSWATEDGETFHLTPAGAAALASGSYHWRHRSRRAFAFLPPAPSQDLGFIPIPPDAPIKLRPGLVDANDLRRRLQTCLQRDDDWKRRHGFPTEILGLCEQAVPVWEAGVLACKVEVCFLLAAGSQWRLYTADPALGLLVPPLPIMTQSRLEDFRVLFGPHLPQPLLSSDWQRAWERGCRANRWPVGKAVRSPRFGQEIQLRIELDRQAKIPEEELWLLAGHGPWHAAARLHFQPSGRSS